MGLSGFVVEVVVVVVVGLLIWCWWVMGCGSRFWVGGIVGRGWLRQRCGFWSGGYRQRWICLGWGLARVWRLDLFGLGFGWGLL